MMEKILIAGSDGFIGSHLSQELASEFDVYGLGNYKDMGNGYKQIDLTDIHTTKEYVKKSPKFDTLIFLVALAHSKGKNKQYNVFHNVNVQTLINLISCFREFDKVPTQIIFSSTISVYGETKSQIEYPETTPLQGQTPYAQTKIEAEEYLLKEFAAKSWILRFAPVYADNFKLNIKRRTQIKNTFFQVSNGQNRLSLLNISNIITAIRNICQHKVPPDIYNLSDTRIYTYIDLLAHQQAQKHIRIPEIFIKAAWLAGKLLKNNFLIENSVKLATDNIYPSTKLQKFIPLNGTLND